MSLLLGGEENEKKRRVRKAESVFFPHFMCVYCTVTATPSKHCLILRGVCVPNAFFFFVFFVFFFKV